MFLMAEWFTALTPEAWTALATILLVVATVLLAFIAYWQTKTTRRQLRAVRANEDGMPEALVMIKNSG